MKWTLLALVLVGCGTGGGGDAAVADVGDSGVGERVAWYTESCTAADAGGCESHEVEWLAPPAVASCSYRTESNSVHVTITVGGESGGFELYGHWPLNLSGAEASGYLDVQYASGRQMPRTTANTSICLIHLDQMDTISGANPGLRVAGRFRCRAFEASTGTTYEIAGLDDEQYGGFRFDRCRAE